MRKLRVWANVVWCTIILACLLFGAVMAYAIDRETREAVTSEEETVSETTIVFSDTELYKLQQAECNPSVACGDSSLYTREPLGCGGSREAVQTLEMPQSPRPEPLGTYRVTAYCACEICCGEWANNRPNGVVYGAGGVELIEGVHCASPLPFGTVIEIEGTGTYEVQDRMADWVIGKYGDKCIDLYFTDHQAALEFGVQYLDVFCYEPEDAE